MKISFGQMCFLSLFLVIGALCVNAKERENSRQWRNALPPAGTVSKEPGKKIMPPKKSSGPRKGPASLPWNSNWDLRVRDLELHADNEHVLNPTGGPVRGSDNWGSGEYLARRNHPDTRGMTIHQGIDFSGEPGRDVVAPLSGELRRAGTGVNSGALMIGSLKKRKHRLKLQHFDVTIPDGPVTQGQVIGKVKDLGKTYPGMTSHVHMEVHEWRPYAGYRAKDPTLVMLGEATASLALSPLPSE